MSHVTLLAGTGYVSDSRVTILTGDARLWEPLVTGQNGYFSVDALPGPLLSEDTP